ncbi:MAG: mevalonate kinase [Candidatus Nitrosopelagicus sp.]|nr:MAG: mevalonate kinase [Candidatus Nitrosopelagicus sp.]
MTSIAKAPGKIILFGEHFVVYQNKAILGAINKYATVTTEKTNTDNILISSSLGQSSIQKDEDVSNVEKKFRPFFYIAKQVIEKNNFEKGITIKIESDIPIGAGLGSSSACCVAAAASILNLFNITDEKEVLELAINAEKTIFPNTSGADCTVSVSGGIIEYQKEKGFSKIETENEFNFIIIDSEQVHSTDKVVERVRKFKENNSDVFTELCSEEERLIAKALDSMKKNDLETIGKCMAQNQMFLEQIGVSNDELLSITKEIEKITFGAKITGAGDGGCIIALTQKDDDLSEYVNTTKYQTYQVTIQKTGMQVFNT